MSYGKKNMSLETEQIMALTKIGSVDQGWANYGRRTASAPSTYINRPMRLKAVVVFVVGCRRYKQALGCSWRVWTSPTVQDAGILQSCWPAASALAAW